MLPRHPVLSPSSSWRTNISSSSWRTNISSSSWRTNIYHHHHINKLCRNIHVMSTNSVAHTGSRRLIGCLQLQVIFRRRATNYRAFLRKMTYKDKASYAASPSCTVNSNSEPRFFVVCGSFICVTWLIDLCDMTQRYQNRVMIKSPLIEPSTRHPPAALTAIVPDLQIYINIYIYICVNIYRYTCIYTTHLPPYPQSFLIYTYTWIYIHICIYIYIYMCVHIYRCRCIHTIRLPL